MKKVLQLATYPTINPLHGGQIRINEIRKFLEGNGCKVKSISLSEKTHQSYSEDDFLIDRINIEEITNVPFCSDYATSELCKNGKYFEFIKKEVIGLNPDIILLEQPWLWPAIKNLLSQNIIRADATIVYSSQNVEYLTKNDILSSHGVSTERVKHVTDNIFSLEKDICKSADIVMVVSKSDAAEFTVMGAKKIVLCENGVTRRSEDARLTAQLDSAVNKRKFVLFVGSAYPPNAQGFWAMLGNSLAFLPPDCIIVVAGGVSQLLEPYMPESAKLFASVNMNRLKLMGFVSEEVLGTLVRSASAIILPIVTGGGSNLKTAEAIASDRPVVATSKSCRGYNFADKLVNFDIADDPQIFRKSILKYLDSQYINYGITIAEKKLRSSVYWEKTLMNLGEVSN